MRIFVALLLTVSSIYVFGQSRIGLKTGLNLSNLGGDSKNTDFKLGYNFGLYGEREINENLFLRPELFFSSQGAKIEDLSYRYSYVNLPVLLKIQIDPNSASLYIGPQFGLLFNAVARDNSEKENITAGLNNVDFSGTIGLIAPVNDEFAIDFRFNHSFSSTSSKISDDDFIPNLVLSISLNYTIK
ncbi:porin family protein [Ekhidna sp.]|uniref:porin family protein n=1 Tax=Ekhidna sp. TaxID=2608089 RepID=UPI00351436E9